jgi:hypothetical protein
MVTLRVFRTNAESYRLEPVGRLTVGPGGRLVPDTGDPALDALLRDLPVTASIRGEPVTPSDPAYAEAVADSIGRATNWRYTAELSDPEAL